MSDESAPPAEELTAEAQWVLNLVFILAGGSTKAVITSRQIKVASRVISPVFAKKLCAAVVAAKRALDAEEGPEPEEDGPAPMSAWGLPRGRG